MLKSITSRVVLTVVLLLALLSCVCAYEFPNPSLVDYHPDNKNSIPSIYSIPDTPIKKQDKEDNDDKSKKDKNSDGKKDKNDDDNNDNSNKKDDSPSKTVKDNHKSDAKTSNDHDDHKTKSDSDTSNTVVTTIIVIATETPSPTQIYTGTNQSPANQKGQSSGSSSSSSSDNSNSSNDSDNGGDATDPNATSAEDNNQDNKGRSNYRKMELALSIVGSVGGTILIAGLFVFTRRQINRKKRAVQKANDVELGNSPSVPPMATAPSFSGGSSNQGIIVPHNQGNNDSVVIDFDNPFSDPSAYRTSNQMQMTTSPITPVAPVHLAPGSYINFRQNQTLSMLSQTTAAVPSAPTAKEIAANENENPFELEATPQYYAQQVSYQHEAPHSHPHSVSHSHSHSVAHSHSVSQDSFGNNRIDNGGLAYNNMIQHLPPPTSTNNKTHHHIPRSTSSPTGSSDDLSELPPPAYTPSAIPNTNPNAIPNAIPSAPPLYALPNLSRSQHEDSRRFSALSSRRHSISSITSTDVRPVPLRRGSGSIAHVSSYT